MEALKWESVTVQVIELLIWKQTVKQSDKEGEKKIYPLLLFQNICRPTTASQKKHS